MVKIKKQYIVANWKMNVAPRLVRPLARAWRDGGTIFGKKNMSCIVMPSVIDIASVRELFHGSSIVVGAQNCAQEQQGSYTGEVSADSIHAAGCNYVLIGHSERRRDCGETNAIVARKFLLAQQASLIPIVCVGEQLAERESGCAEKIVREQLSIVKHTTKPYFVAYEPVWAIGTGRVCPAEDVVVMHKFIKTVVRQNIPVLYGGSVTSNNARSLLSLSDVDGLLIGGASTNIDEVKKLSRSLLV